MEILRRKTPEGTTSALGQHLHNLVRLTESPTRPQDPRLRRSGGRGGIDEKGREQKLVHRVLSAGIARGQVSARRRIW